MLVERLNDMYGGPLFATVGIYVNDCIFPIAYVIVEIECSKPWTCSFSNSANDLEIENSQCWTFMANRDSENYINGTFPPGNVS